MKIIIIGAGVSGLTTYLFLKKHLPPPPASSQSSHSIIIYEAYDTTKLKTEPSKPHQSSVKDDPSFLVTAIGNAIGVSANGLNVLRRLDTLLLDEVIEKGCPVNSWKITNARGWNLVDMKLAPSQPGDGAQQAGKYGDVTGIMIARQALWECLRAKVPDESIVTRKVVDVRIRPDDENSVVFADGTMDSADLIIGADGLRSIVRTAMFRDEGGNDKKAKDYVTPQYEGMSGIGSFIPSSILQEAQSVPGVMNLVFGPNGFFGYGYITSDASSSANEIVPGTTAAWWSTYSLPECPDTRNFDRAAAIAALRKRHSQWKNPVVQHIVKAVAESPKGVDDIFPTWTTPELPTWQKHGCVLVGDAAHALQPSSGQGTSQAFEDAEAFTLLLQHYLGAAPNGETRDAIDKAAKTYVRLREPRLHEIYVRTQKMSKMKGEMGFVMEMVSSAAIYAMSSRIFKDTYNDKLISYDVPSEVEKIVMLN